MRAASVFGCLIALMVSAGSRCACAAVDLGLAVGDIKGEGWSVSGIGIALSSPTPDRATLELGAGAVVLPDDLGRLEAVKLDCGLVADDAGAWRCEAGSAAIGRSPVGPQQAHWRAEFRGPGDWSIAVDGLRVAEGRVDVDLKSRNGTQRLLVTSQRLPVGRLTALGALPTTLSDWGLSGEASGRLELRLRDVQAERVLGELAVSRLSYGSPDGTQAAEDLVFKVDLDATVEAGGWRFTASAALPGGGLYADPLFLDLSESVLTARIDGNWDVGRDVIGLTAWTLDLRDTVNLSGTGGIDAGRRALTKLTVAARSDRADLLYDRLLQPFLIGTPADNLVAGGRLGLVVHVDEQGVEQLGLQVDDVEFADRLERFSARGVSGSVAWDRAAAVPVSHLAVAAASLYRVPTGPFDIRMQFSGDRVRLDRALVVPLLDGELALEQFQLDGALVSGAKPVWEASVRLDGVALEQLTRALDWPEFAGDVSGRFDRMRYADGVFSVGGELALRAFGGEVALQDLRIREPFGTVPVLSASARMRNLDLEALTRTFAFGRITGGLDGELDDLQLVGWQPDRFDLRLYTAEDGPRRRISQRAIENLTELGSGVPAGLSTGLLGIFEEFPYDRIDLQVQLTGDVAELDGLARDGGGYYLVRGAGLPRIDVIGRNRRVNWRELVARLREIQLEQVEIR